MKGIPDSVVNQMAQVTTDVFQTAGILLAIALVLLWIFSPVFGFGRARGSTRMLVMTYLIISALVSGLADVGILASAGYLTWAGLQPFPVTDISYPTLVFKDF